MTDHDDQVTAASEAWSRYCRSIEQTGLDALRASMTADEIDLAEGLRHLTRMVRLTTNGPLERFDAQHPYFWRALGPDMKMGGDNPNGLYLSAPINGTDTYRVRGTRGSALWVSFLSSRSPECLAEGLPIFGAAIFAPDLHVDPDGTYDITLSPDQHDGNWIRTDRYSASLLVRQFFGTRDDVRPMDITIENLTSGDAPKEPFLLDRAMAQLDRARVQMDAMVKMMQGELAGKGAALNTFKTDIGDPTSVQGGVPGGNAVTARWSIAPDEALIVEVMPPTPCAYWDVQVGNIWYESWDYRHHFSGLTCAQAHVEPDGSVKLVVSQRDPGTVNWLEAADHREGHIAIRWQLSDGHLPIPECTVVPVERVASVTGLPAVSADERVADRRTLATAFDARFRP